MATPLQRDLGVARDLLVDWMRPRLGEVADLRLSDLRQPIGAGQSSETLLFEVSWTDRAGTHEEGFVLRVKPTRHRYYLDDDFERQRLTLQLLAQHTEIPVPVIRWHEDDADLFGAPFWIMERIDGLVPVDSPLYNREGWLADLPPAERHRTWRAGVETAAHIPATLPVEHLAFLDKPHRGATGLDQQLAYWRESLDWSSEGHTQPLLEDVWTWLVERRPSELSTALSWGDSRFGNMMFRDGRCVGVLDWEMVSLGGGLIDLGWWLWFDFYFGEGSGVPRLEGLGDRDETAAAWHEASGLNITDLDWYEVFGGFRMAVLLVRGVALRSETGTITHKLAAMTQVNTTTKELARRLGLPQPS